MTFIQKGRKAIDYAETESMKAVFQKHMEQVSVIAMMLNDNCDKNKGPQWDAYRVYIIAIIIVKKKRCLL
jgi:hypothetical protein